MSSGTSLIHLNKTQTYTYEQKLLKLCVYNFVGDIFDNICNFFCLYLAANVSENEGKKKSSNKKSSSKLSKFLYLMNS